MLVNYTYGKKCMGKEESQNKIEAQPFLIQEVMEVQTFFTRE